jgi:ferritin-like protein
VFLSPALSNIRSQYGSEDGITAAMILGKAKNKIETAARLLVPRVAEAIVDLPRQIVG